MAPRTFDWFGTEIPVKTHSVAQAKGYLPLAARLDECAGDFVKQLDVLKDMAEALGVKPSLFDKAPAGQVGERVIALQALVYGVEQGDDEGEEGNVTRDE